MLTDPAALAGTPGAEDLLFAFTIAIAAFSGLDASSALAGEVAVSRRGLKRLFVARAAAAVPYLGIALVASSTLPQTGDRWYEAPMLGVVSAFEQEWLREPLRYVIARLRDRDPRDRLQRGDVRALAARLLARAQPPDPVAGRAAAPALTTRRSC